MVLTNGEILVLATNLVNSFNGFSEALPIKVSFYLVKNKNTLIELAQEIEKMRTNILNEYGTLDQEKNSFIIPTENTEIVNNKLTELLDITQEVKIYSVAFADFVDHNALTPVQMEALMFMIEEE